jgi:transposase IS116/IS110/IS902 family protein
MTGCDRCCAAAAKRRPVRKNRKSAGAIPTAGPLLVEGVERLMTIPAVGPITALTRALEVGELKRFSPIKKAISYCGLRGDEKSSANTVQRTPLSKRRNKHLQITLIEAAKMAPCYSPDLAALEAGSSSKFGFDAVRTSGSKRVLNSIRRVVHAGPPAPLMEPQRNLAVNPQSGVPPFCCTANAD